MGESCFEMIVERHDKYMAKPDRRLKIATGVLVLAILSSLVVTGQDFPQWRGAGRDGRIEGLPGAANWPEKLNEKWKVRVGEGHSTPLVVGQRVYVHSRMAEREQVSAFDLETGRLVWQDGYEAGYMMNPAARGHGKGPKSTPVYADGRLCTLGITAVLSCYEAAKGRLLWRKSYGERFQAKAPLFGTAMSPLIDRGVLYVHVGGDDRGGLLALDPVTGAEKWAWTGDGPGYASPIVTEIAGKRQLVTQTQKYLVGIHTETGGLLWSMPFETEYVQNIVTPLIYGDLLIFSGINKGVLAIRVGWRNNQWVTDQVWQNREVSMYMSSPVLAGNLLFGMSHRNKGQFFCLDARSGKTLWTGDPRQGENAALLLAGGMLLALTDGGELTLTTVASKGAAVVRRYRVAESPTWAHPVITGRRLLIKDESTLKAYTW